MASIDRRERERLETRTRIMDAARHLFAKEGYDAVSMRKIAEAIEYSPTAIYVHFRDKLDLLQQICEADFGALAQGLAELRQIQNPVERIRRMGHAYIRFGADHPNQYRLMFMTETTPDLDRDNACGAKVDANAYGQLRQSCQEAIEQGLIRPEYSDADLVAQVFWSAVHGVASLQITKAQHSWIRWTGLEPLATAVVDGILRGMTDPKSEISNLKSQISHEGVAS